MINIYGKYVTKTRRMHMRGLCAMLLIGAMISGLCCQAAAGSAAGTDTAAWQDAIRLYESYMTETLIPQYGIPGKHEMSLERTGKIPAADFLSQFYEAFIENYDNEKVAELNEINFYLRAPDGKKSLAAAYAADMDKDGIPELITARYVTHQRTERWIEIKDAADLGFYCVLEFYAADGGSVVKIGEDMTDELVYNDWANILLAVREGQIANNIVLYVSSGGHEYDSSTAKIYGKAGKSVKILTDASCFGGEGYMWFKFMDVNAGIDFEAETSFDDVTLLSGSLPKAGEWKDALDLFYSVDELFLTTFDFPYYMFDYDYDAKKPDFNGYYFFFISRLRKDDDAPSFYFTPFKLKLTDESEINFVVNQTQQTSAPSDWAVVEVGLAAGAGLTTAKTAADYQKDVTREEFCELAVKLYETLAGKTAPAAGAAENVATAAAGAAGEAGGRFTDTDNPEIIKAYNLGIVKGVSDARFEPDSKVTRQEMCVMLVRVINAAVPGADVRKFERVKFADGAEIDDWAEDAIYYAYGKGVIKGVGGDRIDPIGNTTCEQAIILCYRAYANRAKF